MYRGLLSPNFSAKVCGFVSSIVSVICNAYVAWLITNGMEISQANLQSYLGGGSEFFFLGIIVFVISQIFKRGIELESETELTI